MKTVRLYITVFAMLVIAVLLLLPEGQHSNDSDSFKLVNVTVFDGETWTENSEITVQRGLIVDGNGQIEGPLETIDGGGGYVIPGLIDAHTHSWGTILRSAVNFGVTTHLDMFSSEKFLRTNSREREYAYPQASLFSSGHLITSKGGHGDQFNLNIETLTEASQAHEAVAKRIAAGSDYIKIVYNAKPRHGFYGVSYTSIDRASLEAVIAAAKAHNVLSVVHVDNELSANHAIEAGVDGLVHSFADKPVSQTTLDNLVVNNVFVIATLSVMAVIANQKRGEAIIAVSPLANKLTVSATKQLLKQHLIPTLPPYYWRNAMNNVSAMINAGVTVLAGTDVGNPGIVSGLSLHDELRLLCDAGLSASGAIKAATSLPAKAFALPQRGFLKPQYRADMILLTQDPRNNINATQSIKTVWLKGKALNDSSHQE